ncbi:hypothetical protein C9374_005944 [Naegleria lovaniensis]|uniref:Uncharacterized protein n=1 Tax=Naegleria lovaniensis TaxID=51637 RepID=A0AA88KJI1_NAELO|nr:uncharacterized protein C9374_005944 [Naegleria lovaniensis]KAG2381560.1 hypothetical protein C9374_005944 [Naegleria lovaniensis]
MLEKLSSPLSTDVTSSVTLFEIGKHFSNSLQTNNSVETILNSTITNSTEIFNSFQYVSFGCNFPFILIYPILAVVCLFILKSEHKEMNRNQKQLFLFLSSLCVVATWSMMTRLGAEFSSLSSSVITANIVYGVLKGVDRSITGWVTFVEFFLISNIAMVFVRSSKDIGAISEKRFKIARYCIVGFQILVIVMTTLMALLLLVMGILKAVFGDTKLFQSFELAIFIFSTLLFMFETTLLFRILFINAATMMKALKAGEGRARRMSVHNYFNNPNNHENMNPQIVNSCEITSSPQTPASDITSEIFPQQEHQQQRDDHAEQVYTGEQLKIIQMKQHALKKVIQILMAISVSMGCQFVAVSCIPLYFLNKYVALGFYALHNSTIAALVIMFLMTHRRVEEMQKLFVASGKKWFGRKRGSTMVVMNWKRQQEQPHASHETSVVKGETSMQENQVVPVTHGEDEIHTVNRV